MHKLFEIPSPSLFSGGYLGEVVDVEDPESLARVQVRLFNFDGVEDHDGAIWARVAAPFAGKEYGAFFIPDVGDEVLVIFVNGDPRFPIVAGSLWHGSAAPSESLGGSHVDRWTLTGKAGTRIAIVEESDATISFTTPSGVSGELTDAGGGKVELTAAGATITLESSGITVQTGAEVKVEASTVKISAGMVTVDAGLSKFSGVVQCDTLISNSVVSTSYTPGAGNVW